MRNDAAMKDRPPYRTICFSLVLCLGLWSGSVRAEETPTGDTISWQSDLPSALARAKETQRVVMVCVNAKYVQGRTDEEPAAKGLREVVYLDSRVVKKSREFICVLLTPDGSSGDYGELRALGVDGKLVSPQHIFINAEGDRILHRSRYWSHGRGEQAVEALLAMMAKALGVPEKEPEDPLASDSGAAPQDEAGRAEWIARTVQQVQDGGGKARDAAIGRLATNDRGGDCVEALFTLLDEHRRETDLAVAIVRGLGRDGLAPAALPVAALLRHKAPLVRGNAAVSLEYIGCPDAKVLAALRKFADKEKDPALANHGFRALGRCGSQEAKVRALLLKKAGSAKSEFASYGPCIGLAYFKGDKKAARGVEKLLKKIGVPGSRRGGGGNVVKRGLVSWTLASIGDPKSATFVRVDLMGGLKHVKAFWVDGLIGFWERTALACEGDEEAMAAVEAAVVGFVQYSKRMDLGRYGAETRNLMDEFRKDRTSGDFRPTGDYLLDDDGGK